MLGDIQMANRGRTASITDPDDNRITFTGGFRVIYEALVTRYPTS